MQRVWHSLAWDSLSLMSKLGLFIVWSLQTTSFHWYLIAFFWTYSLIFLVYLHATFYFPLVARRFTWCTWILSQTPRQLRPLGQRCRPPINQFFLSSYISKWKFLFAQDFCLQKRLWCASLWRTYEFLAFELFELLWILRLADICCIGQIRSLRLLQREGRWFCWMWVWLIVSRQWHLPNILTFVVLALLGDIFANLFARIGWCSSTDQDHQWSIGIRKYLISFAWVAVLDQN